ELDEVGQALDDAVVVLLAVEAVGDVGAAEDGAGQPGVLDLKELLGEEQLDGLVAELLRLLGEGLEGDAAVAPAADGLLDVSLGLVLVGAGGELWPGTSRLIGEGPGVSAGSDSEGGEGGAAGEALGHGGDSVVVRRAAWYRAGAPEATRRGAVPQLP